MDLSSERKEDSCWQINSKPRIACEELTKGNTHTKPRGKHRESEKGGNLDRPVASAATHPKREQNVPEVTKKLGVQPESGGWENSSVQECDDRRADGCPPPAVRPQPAGEAHQDGLAEEAEVHREELAAEVLRAEGTAALLLQGRRGHEAAAVFGQRLDETVAYEQKFGPHLVPILVEKCAEFILQHGLNEEGIFRLPGQDNLVKQLRDAFDAGERPSFDRETDVHTVASLLKLYLRDLPEPVVPWNQYEGFLLCGQLMNADEAKAQQELVKQLSILPRDNYSLLSYICRFLHEIQLNCGVNKMSVDNLATVIGVNLIRSKVEDPAVIMRGTPQIQRVMTMMIRDHEVLFPKSKDAPLSPPAQKNDPKKPPVARSSVGWDATEDPPISRTESFSNVTSDSDTTSPTGQRPNDGFLEESSKAPREKLGDWKLQSRKRTQTLPNRKCFLTSAFQGANSSKVEIFKNEFWSPSSEVKAGEGHRRTMSQGVPPCPDSQRTSTYDNVPAPPRTPGDEAAADSYQACDSKRETLASSTSETGPGKKNSGEEELESLQRVVQELQKEIETQKQTYEEQIKNLEKENYDVWAKVVRLNEELEKEKKKSAALEISLRNVERSREDVERRNKALEEEVKEFVKSMKEPKADA
ncbi:rho GTPase-activating protein 25 isoform X3 [Mustela erminea]|uniref:rho GTPase-activating protein 25 isoform X3 n=1 Tax=Mustela erminea TaxID=36723 RepID=UPI0013871E6D|nr:rho GTPase-activating protein 25 isoform X3 [Mustela erminea]